MFQRRGDDWGFAERYPAPETPFDDAYGHVHNPFLAEVLDSSALLDRFAQRTPLPRDYGPGLDERVVEYPWLFGSHPRGRVLDAGSTLNHAHILDRLLLRVELLHIATLEPEPEAFTERRISYLYSDLRDLPLRDAFYDTVISISTLEHVGMDNERYGSAAARAADANAEAARAARELRRVLKPGGRILVSVPYGAREDHGWFRQLDADDVHALVEAFEPKSAEITVYAYSSKGWQLSDLKRAAKAQYRDFVADPRPVPDRAAAARAVACVECRY